MYVCTVRITKSRFLVPQQETANSMHPGRRLPRGASHHHNSSLPLLYDLEPARVTPTPSRPRPKPHCAKPFRQLIQIETPAPGIDTYVHRRRLASSVCRRGRRCLQYEGGRLRRSPIVTRGSEKSNATCCSSGTQGGADAPSRVRS